MTSLTIDLFIWQLAVEGWERVKKKKIFFRFLRPMRQYVHEQRLHKLID